MNTSKAIRQIEGKIETISEAVQDIYDIMDEAEILDTPTIDSLVEWLEVVRHSIGESAEGGDDNQQTWTDSRLLLQELL